MGYQAVTFDFWNTLVLETPAPVELRIVLWRERLAEAGHQLADETLSAAFGHAWDRFDTRWRANEPSTAAIMAGDALAHLGVEVEESLAAELADLYLEASLMTPRELLPNVAEALDRLGGRGVRVGVVSDVAAVPASQIKRWLDELGVLPLIDHFSFSDEVGVFKPDRRIFQHALAGLGVSDPTRAAHVGDLARTDVAGANAAGMTSVQYVGGRTDEEAVEDAPAAVPDHVIADHLELLEVLGL